MIDLTVDHILLLAKTASVVPSRPHVATLYRWWRRGVRGIKLETVVIGGRRYTSLEALQRFADRLSEATPTAPGNIVRQPRARIDHIDHLLDEAGF